MARDTDTDDSLPPLGEGTEKVLEDAKKGKPRSFLLICKGSSVKYLKVKKKAIKPSEIADAKKLGYKGEACIGVITGQGMDLVFNLSIEDGYESEPCKERSLKDFLDEHADFKCKPTFAIVPVAPEIPFDDDELANPLIARFVKLRDSIAAASLESQPKSDLLKEAAKVRVQLQDENFVEAAKGIDQLEAKLKSLLAGSGAPAESSVPPVSPTSTPGALADNPDQELAKKLREALNKLVPQIKSIVESSPDRKQELLAPVAAIKQQLDAGDLQAARQGLLTLGNLIRDALAGTKAGQPIANTPNQQTLDSKQLEYEKKLSALLPRYEFALRAMLGDTSKFRTVMAYITEQAESGGFDNALKAIDKLSQAIDSAIREGFKETDVIPENVVADRKKFLQSHWQSTLAAIRAEVAKVRIEVDKTMPEQNGGELADAFQRYLDSFCDHFSQVIWKSESASASNLKPLDAARDAIEKFRSRVETDQVIIQLDRSAQELEGEAKGIAVQRTILSASSNWMPH